MTNHTKYTSNTSPGRCRAKNMEISTSRNSLSPSPPTPPSTLNPLATTNTSSDPLFSDLSDHKHIALFVLTLLSFPVTKRCLLHENLQIEYGMEWNQRVLLLLKEQLIISSDYYDAYKMIYPTSYVDNVNQEISQVFYDILQSPDPISSTIESSHSISDEVQPSTTARHLAYLGKVAIILILYGLYDARGRHLIRNLRKYLRISETEYLSLEAYLASVFLEIEDTLTRSKKPTENDSKLLKYAKIGAVGLGAGALLAFTGGLAAPAVAAAFLVLGGSTFVAAGLTSAAALASVFGTAGAGLAGYKMARRIRGVEEFEFEPQGKKGKLAVLIAVSGWLIDDEDYKRMYGVVPNDLTLEERLERYYEIYCPERLPKIEQEAFEWRDDPHHLLDQLTELYGADPRYAPNLVPPTPYAPPDLPENDQISLIAAIQSVMRQIDEREQNKGNETHSIRSSESSARAPLIPDWAKATSGNETEVETKSNLCGFEDLKTSAEEDAPISSVDEEQAILEEDYSKENLLGNRWHWSSLEISSVYELNLLRWETELQKELGNSLISLLKSMQQMVAEKVLQVTVLAALMSAVLIPYTLLKLTDVIDNTWTLATERADAAGIELAHALLARPQGSRSVTLVGHSIGARLIFACLQELSRCQQRYLESLNENQGKPKSSGTLATVGGAISTPFRAVKSIFNRKSDTSEQSLSVAAESPQSANPQMGCHVTELTSQEREQFDRDDEKQGLYQHAGDIIQDVVLLGTPIGIDALAWERARQVVSGRLINGYSDRDYVLALLYRYEKWAVNVAGLKAIDVEGVENVNLSSIISKHTDYCVNMNEILVRLNLSAS